MSEERTQEMLERMRDQEDALDWSFREDAAALIERQAAALKEAESELRQLRDFLTFTAGGDVYALIDKKAAAEAEARQLREQVSAAIGSSRFMDPPDGGDVSLPEQIRRMREQLAACERDAERYRWLRNEAAWSIAQIAFRERAACNVEFDGNNEAKYTDDVIDAAMSAKEQG